LVLTYEGQFKNGLPHGYGVMETKLFDKVISFVPETFERNEDYTK
jgi:hypothetical protein